MTLRYMTGESRSEEDRRNCRHCDNYRGYVCAEHREPSYETLVKRVEELSSKRDSFVGWYIIEESDDGSLLLQSHYGQRRRVWQGVDAGVLEQLVDAKRRIEELEGRLEPGND